MNRLSVFILLLLISSCATHRQLQVVERVSKDTVYINKVQYDSIYVNHDRLLDRSRDTLLIKDKTVEYRYKLLRDTVFKTRVVSIPVVRKVEVIREVHHIPWWSRLLSWIGAIALILLLFCKKVPAKEHFV